MPYPHCELLQQFSPTPSHRLDESNHAQKLTIHQREQGFASNPYPCIGLYRFLNLTLLTHPLYNAILQRLKSSDASYLDLGCCFGQDLRQLVNDGVPSERLVGLDIAEPLIERGYDFSWTVGP